MIGATAPASAAEEISALFSPQFSLSYPEIHHQELIPPDAAKAMDFVWKTKTFGERKVVIGRLSDVFVAEEGVVFTSDGELLTSTVTQHSAGEVARAKAAVDQAILAKDSRVLGGTSVLCKKRGAQNYGHWLCEMLPKAFLAKSCLHFEGLSYLTPELDGALGRVIVDSLSALDIPASRVVGIGREIVRVETLITVDGVTSHGQFMSPLVMSCLDAVSVGVQGRGSKNLFVSRRSSRSRRFVDEEAIAAKASARGYTIINPGEMNLTEQVAAFKTAERIVGVMGAEMANLAFAPRGCRATLLAPASMSDTFFWFISGLRGLQYQEMRCAQTGPAKGFAPWDTDLLLAPGDLDVIFPL